MGRKKIRSNKNYLLKAVIVSLAILILFFVVLVVKRQTYFSNKNTMVSSSNELRKHHSNILDITIDIPEHFLVEERFGEIFLESDGKIIIIHRIGTNKKYKNIDEFLDDGFNLDNRPKDIEKQHITIDGYNAEAVIIKYPTAPDRDNKAYYFHINDGFYHLYTTSSSLYSILDQIAQSFRYEP